MLINAFKLVVMERYAQFEGTGGTGGVLVVGAANIIISGPG